MKTITITIDEAMLKRVGRLGSNRSELVLTAVQNYLERVEAEAQEAAAFRRHRARLAKQARGAVREQAGS